MRRNFVPFAKGPSRPKQVISLGLFRTGSHSLEEALTILGYRDVFHAPSLADNFNKWDGIDAAADANIPCLPSYNGKNWTREDWDRYLGPCEALTDVAPFTESLLDAYPEARVILVKRDFDSWKESFYRNLVFPSYGILAWLSGNVFEPVVGVHLSQTAWKMYMGLLGVCSMSNAHSPQVMRASYKRHHANVRRLVPADRLLELNLQDLGWEPLCRFLEKAVPDVPFPHLNKSRQFENKFLELHMSMLLVAVLKILKRLSTVIGVTVLALWVTNMFQG